MNIAIDFGTSFSQSAVINLGRPEMLLGIGEYGIPSEFYYDKEYGIQVGVEAMDFGQGNAAKNLVSEVKMKLSEKFVLDGRTFTSKEIVERIFETVINKAVSIAKQKAINEKIEGIVITVPAKFTMQERNLIMQAAESCIKGKKLPIKAILKEPVAAALSYYKTELESDKYVLVYDLGGGTCDIALVKSDKSLDEAFDVVDTDMLRIGGRNFDEALINYITDVVEHNTGTKIVGNEAYEEKVRRAAILAKHQLSDASKSQVIAKVEINGRINIVPIKRNVFEEITKKILDETLDMLREMYDKHSFNCKIDEVICVGGSSNMLQVESEIKRILPSCKVRVYEPEHAVVNGAAFFADLIKNNPGVMMVNDISSFSYGVEVYDCYEKDKKHKVISNIIKSGNKLPVQGKKTYSPIEDNCKKIDFDVYESEVDSDKYELTEKSKRYIGTASLILPPNSPKSIVLTCEIKLNDKGFLEVKATEPGGKKVEAKFDLKAL